MRSLTTYLLILLLLIFGNPQSLGLPKYDSQFLRTRQQLYLWSIKIVYFILWTLSTIGGYLLLTSEILLALLRVVCPRVIKKLKHGISIVCWIVEYYKRL